MLKESKKLENNRYELEITIDGESFRAAILKAYKKEVKNIAIPGFRKGKAPLSIIEAKYGEGFFYESALNLLYADALDAAAAEAGIELVNDKIDFEMVSISKQDGVDFKVKVTVVPTATVGKYKGLTVEKVTASVSAKEVNAELNALAERNSRMVAVEDRATAMGDIAVIDFEGFIDDKAFEGGKGEAFSLTLGSGQFIPGFEEQVVGHNVGDEFDVNVTFPEDYGSDELKGKPAVFKCKLHEIKVKELPELDDEFAKDVSEFDTLDALKKDIKAKALERKKTASENELENDLIDAMLETLEVEIPEAMIQDAIQRNMEEFAYRLQMQGLKMEDYIKYTGATAEMFAENFRPQAEKQVKVRLALDAVVAAEKFEITDDELNDEIKKIAEQYGVEEDKVKAAFSDEQIKKDIASRKAIELVKAEAVITEVKEKTPKAAEEKTEEKKPAAKKTTAAKKTSTAAKKPAAKKTAEKAEDKAE